MDMTNKEIDRAFFIFMSKLNHPSYEELAEYGMTLDEYTKPTLDTLRKLRDYAMDLKYNRKVR